MPKVNIYENRNPGRILQDDGTWVDAAPEHRRISVGWARGQDAQLGVGWVDPVLDLAQERGQSKTLPSGWSPGETDEAGKVWQSQWVDLDRHTINHLIRELRKARDEAFGRDE